MLVALCLFGMAWADSLIEQKTFSQVEQDEEADKLVLFYKASTDEGKKIYDAFEGAAEKLEDTLDFFWAVNCEDSASKGTCESSGLDKNIFFSNGEVGIEQYTGELVVADIVKYVENKFVERHADKVLDIADDGSEFYKSLDKDSSKLKFVKFYQPWCGHCKKLAPEWERAAGHFPDVEFWHIECGKNDETQKFCSEHQVSSYPTLYLFKGSQKTKYEENGRNIGVFETYLAKKDLKWVPRNGGDAAQASNDDEDEEDVEDKVEDQPPVVASNTGNDMDDIREILVGINSRLDKIETLLAERTIVHSEL